MPLIAIFGGASSGLLVADAIAALHAGGSPVALAGFLNDEVPAGGTIGGVPVLAGFEAWRTLPHDVRLIAAFPSEGRARERHARLRALAVDEDRWIAVVHPSAIVSARATVAAGAYVGPNAAVEHGAAIGAHAIVRGGAYVSHDVIVDPFAFVGPNATLLGRSRVGPGAHVGANAVVRDGIAIGAYALVGIGATVIEDVPPDTVVGGTPARPLRQE